MTKLEIFDDIVSIMAKDSATSKDKGAGDFEKYRAEISEDMSFDSFALIVRRYLASFRVPGHLAFASSAPAKTVGFTVRRIGDALYVVSAEAGLPVAPGDRVVALDGLPIPEAAEKYQKLLFGESNERQDWHGLLPLFAEATVETASGTQTIPMPFVEKRTRREPYGFRKINDSTLLLRFDDFADTNAIHTLIHQHEAEIGDTENLIIDVRENAGGSDTAFLPLLNYCFGENDRLDASGSETEINYTERNVDTRLQLFEGFLSSGVPDEVRSYIEQEIATQKACRGKGYYRPESTDEDSDFHMNGTQKPEHVYILSDSNCGSSGDAFVEMCRGSGKVTVVGRPTMGILDYSNLSFVEYGDYQLLYPTSRRLVLDKGIAMGGHGVPVDVYIPFTEEEIHRDVIMDRVMELIQKQ